MILQPVVENAIVHGISARPGEGRIAIGARRSGTGCVLPGVGQRSRIRGQHGAGPRDRTPQHAGDGWSKSTARHPVGIIDGAEGGAIVRIEIPFVTTGALPCPPDAMIRALIADDEPLAREGIRARLPIRPTSRS